MPRYINAILAKAEFTGNFQDSYTPGEIHALIDNVPTADVEEVRHGHWTITEYEYYDCSVCGESYYNGCDSHKEARERLEKRSYDVYSYCPYCGAKMDEKESGDDDSTKRD